MNYAKINSGEVVHYPYTWDDLLKENPFTRYDDRFTIIDWYSQTEDAGEGNYLVEVVVEDYPSEVDHRTKKVIRPESPILVDGVWTMRYLIENKTEEEIAQYDIDAARPVGAANNA